MIKLSKYKAIVILSFLVMFIIVGCGNKQIEKNNKQFKKNVYGIEQFTSDMKAKNYKFKIKDVQKDFLPTTRKIMTMDKEVIDIYSYNSSKDMENDAKNIDKYGSQYSNGDKSVIVDWISYPHFYKKGTIIVQYVGKNEKIISDLNSILGKQFVGH
jgi:uncharacterized lipoprotein NlpE involved in copper resistance